MIIAVVCSCKSVIVC